MISLHISVHNSTLFDIAWFCTSHQKGCGHDGTRNWFEREKGDHVYIEREHIKEYNALNY